MANARNGRKSNGAKTAAGKLTIVQSNTGNGIRSSLAILKGIEDPDEYERFQQGFFAHWQPVGTHESECVRHLAHCYWRLRRATRYESEATIAEIIKAARHKEVDLRVAIEQLLGIAIEAEAGANGDTQGPEWSSPAWWHQVLVGPDNMKLTRSQAAELFGYVVSRIAEAGEEEDEDEDDEDGNGDEEEDDMSVPDVRLPAGPITLGALREQLGELSSLCQSDDCSPIEILQQKYELVVYEDRCRKEARAQAFQFVSRHLLLPPDQHSTLLNERRQVLSEISRHISILERLQAVRRGELIPAPVSVDVNVTGQVHGPGGGN
jgi:hypothetical protein